MLKNHYRSIDFLRGLGVFFVLVLHTSFYYYADIYDVDIANPSLIITLIGFLLMFAGLFAMLSGLSYTIQYLKAKTELEKNNRLKHMSLSGFLLLIVAYIYFIFTGPGIIHFDTRSMDESLIVSLINQGSFQKLTQERLFYVDSLVMLSLNIFLMTLLFKVIKKQFNKPHTARNILMLAVVFLVISYVRIPLYNVYLSALDSHHYFVMILLNWFVGKNNPILPFFAFALFGVWTALLLKQVDKNKLKHHMLPVILVMIVVGVSGYLLTPETMLERAIDPTWYFIMVIQIGLFLGMILAGLIFFDFNNRKNNPLTRFISRFGVSGLTPFFLEQIISALIFLLMRQLFNIQFGMIGAILYGFSLALAWGVFLIFWEKKQYKYGIEWAMSKMLNQFSPSSKLKKLAGERHELD